MIERLFKIWYLLSLHRSFWRYWRDFDNNTAGYIFICSHPRSDGEVRKTTERSTSVGHYTGDFAEMIPVAIRKLCISWCDPNVRFLLGPLSVEDLEVNGLGPHEWFSSLEELVLDIPLPQDIIPKLVKAISAIPVLKVFRIVSCTSEDGSSMMKNLDVQWFSTFSLNLGQSTCCFQYTINECDNWEYRESNPKASRKCDKVGHYTMSLLPFSTQGKELSILYPATYFIILLPSLESTLLPLPKKCFGKFQLNPMVTQDTYDFLKANTAPQFRECTPQIPIERKLRASHYHIQRRVHYEKCYIIYEKYATAKYL
ncbi:uncharacterized protein EV420DRAFT_1488638 [Desarmillaria tabescens]|uniref:Uncharacterized protein n=1 Tax=Armillaria tabescens TaxID=1929756 RepID=A0AA39J552_ARMTA|nr:uncharacterized protein EV420DRAFT_1488638 [Desarmillaria tabescens]KAK0434518.1 hypothetical protein EV420DRAFT_1488638 [Desarmillaria tabescens]